MYSNKHETFHRSRQLQKKSKNIKSRIFHLIIVLLFITGPGTLLYPVFSTYWNDYRNSRLIEGYSQAINNLDAEDYENLWEEAAAYNKQHKTNILVDAFQEQKDRINEELSYNDLLNPNGNGIMGYLQIAKVGIKLPVYHGTGPEVMDKGCGHLQGTSLPVGGTGSHSVLSAHRGLPSAKLFTDLDRLETGDLFLLHILGRTLAYEVDQILTVLPEESDSLAIDPEKDYVTLVTCTPYAVNTHRLLVRGHRTAYVPSEGTGEDIKMSDRMGMTEKIFLAGVAALIVLVVFMLFIYYISGRRG